MGLCLIAASGFSWFLDPANWSIVAMVAVGLGAVIFVHELGHFAVAKWCGVKCEKFYLGFDIYGWKFCKFQWGETEYGIGVLPLGGYVKMLGQEDNPARVAEEIERAREQQAAGNSDGPLGFDPRSYLAQSVPKRMAIISAGVIMNVIFAVVFAAVAYSMGAPEMPCVVGGALPGDAAWRLDLRPGDVIEQIGDVKNPRFRDMQSTVVLGDLENGLPLVVRRRGEDQLLEMVISPDRSGFMPMIGITSASSLTLRDPPVAASSPASEIEGGGFKAGDEILAVGDRPVSDFVDLDLAFMENTKDVAVKVRRIAQAESSTDAERFEDVVVNVPSVPMRTVGLIMEPGEITAVQDHSPAAEAGLRAGDRLLQIDGQPIGDPLRLPLALAGRAGQTIKLTIERAEEASKDKTKNGASRLEKEVKLREALTDGRPIAKDHPLGIDSLGIALAVNNRVAQVVAGSPAANKGIKPGDEIDHARLIPPPASKDEEELDIPLAGKRSWPIVFDLLQQYSPGTEIELSLDAGKKKVTLLPSIQNDWPNADRGLLFEPLSVIRKAEGVGEAVRMGLRETGDSLAQVYRFLRKIGHQVPVKGVGGPVAIAQAAGASASAGTPQLLLFLTMLSANLAILNFLPIPLLDGGHMVFLILEGIRRKPVSERVVVAFHYAGFLFLISLMLFVLALDFGLISRHG